MATIEERAEKWTREKLAREHALSSVQDAYPRMIDAYLADLAEAYIAGSERTRFDYASDLYTRPGPLTVRFHSEDGCPGHIVAEQSCPRVAEQSCPRCECSCGAH
jgi:hypothetical protein